ncbi:MAG: FAD-binding oxidoreductase [Pseudomonadota bacterium]
MTVQPLSNRIANEDLIAKLEETLGERAVLTDQAACTLYAQDVYTKAEPALAVIQPSNTGVLAKAVGLTTAAGFAIVPRGGGMSYTSGYVPAEGSSVMVDMTAMDAILEINEEDMYVRVEAGCTWKKLHEALAPKGLRTPFWGTLSGSTATIGGGMSQNGAFWGCGTAGSAVESVLSLKVVLADGSVIETGSAAHANAAPFMRNYGPDLTGIFTSDAGALGFKAEITLRLQTAAKHKGYCSFNTDDGDVVAQVLAEVSRQGLATEVFAFNPFLQTQQMKRSGLLQDTKYLKGVVTGQDSLMKGIKEGAKMALAGKSDLNKPMWTIHTISEGRSEAAVDADVAAIRDIAKKAGANEIANTVPKATAGIPFGPVNSMIGPDGERWVPIHALVPHSKGAALLKELDALTERFKPQMDALKIDTGYLLLTMSTTIFLIEPVFYWQDEIKEIHDTYVEDAILKKITRFPENLEARAVVEEMRQAMLDLFEGYGAGHFQIGKTYRYGKTLMPGTKALLKAIKAEVDPDNRINPGSLGIS